MANVKLTPQLLLKKAKRQLGLRNIPINMDDNELLDILYEDTLPTFSIYFPSYYYMKADLTKCEKAPIQVRTTTEKAYYLDIPHGLEILEISDIQRYEYGLNDYYVPNTTGLDSYSIFNNQIMQGMIESMMSVALSWEFKSPNILIIDEPESVTPRTITMTFNVLHANDLSTVNFTYRDELTKLFIIDLKIALYNDLKFYDKTDSTFGQIDLKIDSWEDAPNQREELLNYWEEIFLSHRQKTIYKV